MGAHSRADVAEAFEAAQALAVRVLVAGDAAVGKTSLVESICELNAGGAILGNVKNTNQQKEWTCGCALSLTHETLTGNLGRMIVEVELWEVGGTKMYAHGRPVFYDGYDAILLVYDVSNIKSYHSLVAWLFELCTSVLPPSLRYWDAGGGSGGVPDLDLEQGDGGALQQAILQRKCPVLFVANKCDLPRSAERPTRPRPPDRPPLLDRLLGGGDNQINIRSAADERLLDGLCDFVAQGIHTEASSRGEGRFFDAAVWREFAQRAVEFKFRSGK